MKTGRPKIKENERTSARYRATQRVAQLAGFEYDFAKYGYGGFFDAPQLEKIEFALVEAKTIKQTIKDLNK